MLLLTVDILVYNVSMAKKKTKASASLHLRLPAKLKRDAERIFDASGLDVSSAVRLFFVSVVAKQAIPLKFRTADGYPPDFVEELHRMAEDKKNLIGPFTSDEAIAYVDSL